MGQYFFKVSTGTFFCRTEDDSHPKIMRTMRTAWLFQVLLFFVISKEVAPIMQITKVVVPAVYAEWIKRQPDWVRNVSIQQEYGFEVFLYQKSHPKQQNYMASNRGLEAGVYLRYIVDHYDTFPDIAVFVHAAPEKHQPQWKEMIRCLSPNASYVNINNVFIRQRTIETWQNHELQIWIEQCYRNVLALIWGMTPSQLSKILPPTQTITFSTICCHQFVLSRAKVHERPLSVWQKLLQMIGEQQACHVGDPDYKNLYAFRKYGLRVGPEPPNLGGNGPGSKTQVNAMEHLADLVYGGSFRLMGSIPTQADYCSNFMRDCPSSPCTAPPNFTFV